MSKLGAVFLSALMLAAAPLVPLPAHAAEAAPHKIKLEAAAAWGCRAKHDVFDLLFLALSTSFDDRLATALADGRCIFFSPGEAVMIIENSGSHGLVKVQRGGAEPVTYWTPLRNVE
jgi:hypothetical protein